MNCRPSCVTECPPVTSGTRCAMYRERLQLRMAQMGQEAGADVPFRLQKLGVPADAILAIKAPTQTVSLAAAKRFLVAPKNLIRTLLLIGVRGVGKTTAAAYVMADAVRHWDWNAAPSGGKQLPPFVWAHAAEVTGEINFGKVNPDWLDNLKACRLLVLDDLGKDATEPGLAALRDVLTVRHEKQRRTVITANLSPEALAERYGESWFDRVKVAAIAPALDKEKSLRRRS